MEEKVQVRQVSEKEIWVGDNRFYLGKDNIRHLTCVGDIDEKIALEIKEVTFNFFSIVEGKLKLFIALNKAGKPSSGARKILTKIFENEKIGKIAMFGIHPVARVLASFIMGISKKKDMRFFKTKEEALLWLKE